MVDDVEDLFLVFVCVSMILHEQLLEGWVCFFGVGVGKMSESPKKNLLDGIRRNMWTAKILATCVESKREKQVDLRDG